MPYKLFTADICLKTGETGGKSVEGELCSENHLRTTTESPRLMLTGGNESHDPNYPLSHYHLRRNNTYMSLRNPFSGLKKKLKRRLAGGRHEPDGGGTDIGGEGDDWTGSLAQPGPHVIAERERNRPLAGSEAGTDGGRVDSTDPPLHSDDSGFVPASEREHERGGEVVAIRGEEVNKRNLYLALDVQGVAESGPSREENDVEGGGVDRVNPPPSTPLISHGGGSESM